MEPADKDEKPQREAVRLIAEARVKTGDFIARLMMAYAGFAAFCVFTLLSPDRLMVEAKPSLDMPFAGTVSFLAFMVVAPAVLIGMRVYLEVYVQRWRVLDAELDADSEPKTVSPLKQPLLRVFSWAVLYPLLPAMLALFTWKASALDVWGDTLLFLTLVCTFIQVYQFVRWPWFARAAHVAVVSGSLFAVVSYEGGLPHRGLGLFREDLGAAYLVEADLRGAVLIRADLAGADLAGADLSGANLTNARITDANLSGADLKDAFLGGADLSGANLSGADLSEADLTDAWFSDAVFKDAFLRGTDLSGAHLMWADFTGADVSGTIFEGAEDVPTLFLACADPNDPPTGLRDDVNRPDPWEPCPED